MSGPAFDRQTSEQSRPARPDDSGDRALFDAVLHETENAFVAADPEGMAILADLRQVARTYAGQPFELDTVGIDLVRALLDRQVSRTVAASRIWQQACRRIAQTLCDDPAARERLDRLWNHLQGSL